MLMDYDLNDRLILEIKKKPVLWNTEKLYFEDKDGQRLAWKELSRSTKVSESALKEAWNNLRISYIRELINEVYLQKKSEWSYFNAMAYLRNHVAVPGAADEGTEPTFSQNNENSVGSDDDDDDDILSDIIDDEELEKLHLKNFRGKNISIEAPECSTSFMSDKFVTPHSLSKENRRAVKSKKDANSAQKKLKLKDKRRSSHSKENEQDGNNGKDPDSTRKKSKIIDVAERPEAAEDKPSSSSTECLDESVYLDFFKFIVPQMRGISEYQNVQLQQEVLVIFSDILRQKRNE